MSARRAGADERACSRSSVTMDNAQLIDRTFENVISKLVSLGANIEVAAP
jgi:UDP-N-acetylglucosamine enolpyruvyl transferase